MILVGNVVQAAQNEVVTPQVIEAFTLSDLHITGGAAVNQDVARSKTKLQIYNLDSIQRIEAKLSKDLTADHAQSKQVVLQHIQQLNKADSARMQHAAMGLAKAMQYGIDRYPAIVFNGKTVVYGVTDIGEAIQRYRQWQEGQKQ